MLLRVKCGRALSKHLEQSRDWQLLRGDLLNRKRPALFSSSLAQALPLLPSADTALRKQMHNRLALSILQARIASMLEQ
eukprot:CAMPEP_0119339554 /NCGR_PEP_ID=MMETSP1333-20130426/98489_1 /TAXON_ID=418940 /ORGANISM="Scyphosphaera apsteinii, Strain RCC1455" /LENGTH=78 /DNA_ID=CAMNT_0007351091 /DNA_START=622 /DNA_END=858 /DNA_ORIENTATION=+